MEKKLTRRLGQIALCLAGVLLPGVQASLATEVNVWFGTTGDSRGIYQAQLTLEDGKLSAATLAAEVSRPGFLTWHPQRPILYAVCGIDGSPSVAAYQVEAPTGQPSLLNAQPIGDGGATHLCVDATGSALLTVQYGGGSVAVFPLSEDGSIQPRKQIIEHEGGVRRVGNRQNSAHPHWVGTSPDNRFVFVPDLGLDAVLIYRLSTQPLALKLHGRAAVPDGSGPRHLKFHPSGQFVYVLNELALTVTSFAYDAEAGKLTELQTIATLSAEQKSRESFNSASEIRVHPTGSFVYTANRGHDTITVFRVQPQGTLQLVEQEPVRGAWPRNFNLSPDGKWLLAAGRDSNTVAVFSVDLASGQLTYDRQIINVPSPICVLFERPDR